MMDFRQLRHVIEICRCGSFVRAARVLGISQPALSRSIARLEEQLGVSLFERTGKGIRPTVFAENIVSRAERALSDVSTLVEEVRLLARGQSGRIIIGVGAAARTVFAVPLVVKLGEAFPALRIDVVDDRAPKLIRMLQDREIDMVITALELAPPGGDLTVTRLFDDEVCFFTRPGHPILKKRRSRTLDEILEYPMALPGRSWVLAERAARLDPRKLRNLETYMTHDYAVLKDIVEQSDAIGQAPIMVYADAFAAGTIQKVPVRRTAIYQCVALTHRVSEFSPVICRALALAKEAALELPITNAGIRAA